MENRIFCFGIINLDILVFPVDNWPSPGSQVQADRVFFVPGGTALNTAMTIKKLGLNDVNLMGCVGDDDASRRIITDLSNKEIEINGLCRQAQANTGICIVTIQSSGERSFIYSSGANDKITSFSEYLPNIVNESMVHLGGVLDMAILAGKSLLQIVNGLKEKNCFISMDLAFDSRHQGWGAIKDALSFTDLLSMNEQEAFALTGESDTEKSTEKIFNQGCPFVVIKLGSRGAFVQTKDFKGIIPGFSVSAADTTGAGDAFSGALLTALLNGDPPQKAVSFANAVGACCVQKVGPIDGVRTYKETLKFMEA